MALTDNKARSGPQLEIGPSNDPRSDAVHHLNTITGDYIESRAPNFFIRIQGRVHQVRLPLKTLLRVLSPFRLARRLLRLDKCNAVFVENGQAVVLLYRGGIYRWAPGMDVPVLTGELRQCRNVLHQSIAVVDEQKVYFGEYGGNSDRQGVPVWASRDAGRSWAVVHEFPAGTIKHIHGVYHDPFTDHLWICTGDFENECFLYRADKDFKQVDRFGDGSQAWRTVGLMFEKDRISWIMDSQLETSHLYHMDRKTGALTRGPGFPGPAWYVKRLDDGISLIQTTCEIGPGVLSRYAHLFASRDNDNWIEVAKFRKDIMPIRLFKSGLLSFADGPQTSDRFALFGEAVKQLDGKAKICSLQWT